MKPTKAVTPPTLCECLEEYFRKRQISKPFDVHACYCPVHGIMAKATAIDGEIAGWTISGPLTREGAEIASEYYQQVYGKPEPEAALAH